MEKTKRSEVEDLFNSINRDLEDIGFVDHKKGGTKMVEQKAPPTAKERVEIELEEERSFYRSWEDSNKILWEAIQRSKMRMLREIKRLRVELQKALEERDSAVEELAKARRVIEKVVEDVGVGRR